MEFNQHYQSINLEYCRASMNKRFANYIVDMLFCYFIFFFLGFIFEILLPNSISASTVLDGIIGRIISVICYGLIMFLVEAAFGGKSLGKLITSTKAVNLDGSDLGISKAFVRNIIRSIPFNAFSSLRSSCRPWHDEWSDTIVVDEKVLSLAIRKDNFFQELKKTKDDSLN